MGKSPNRCFPPPIPRAVKVHWSTWACCCVLLMSASTVYPDSPELQFRGSIGLAQRSSHCSVNWSEHCNIDRAAHMGDAGRGRTCDRGKGERFQRGRALQGDQQRAQHSRGHILHLGSTLNLKGVDNRGSIIIHSVYLAILRTYSSSSLAPAFGDTRGGLERGGRNSSPKIFPSPIWGREEPKFDLPSPSLPGPAFGKHGLNSTRRVLLPLLLVEVVGAPCNSPHHDAL